MKSAGTECDGFRNFAILDVLVPGAARQTSALLNLRTAQDGRLSVVLLLHYRHLLELFGRLNDRRRYLGDATAFYGDTESQRKVSASLVRARRVPRAMGSGRTLVRRNAGATSIEQWLTRAQDLPPGIVCRTIFSTNFTLAESARLMLVNASPLLAYASAQTGLISRKPAAARLEIFVSLFIVSACASP